jgi:transglutaminase-like putative cysteine protease
MPEFKISHKTKYLFDNSVFQLANLIKLFPIEDESQKLVMQKIEVTGNPDIFFYHDYWGNKTGSFTLSALSGNTLEILSEISVVTFPLEYTEKSMDVDLLWKKLAETSQPEHRIDFLMNESFQSYHEIESLSLQMKQPGLSPMQVVMNLSNHIFTNFTYKTGLTTVESTIDDVWNLKAGVCQDFAHLLVAMLRILKIPARYVSGYICPNQNGMRGDGATHAWVEAYLPDVGWFGIDPTNNCIANEKHVRIAIGRNFTDCSPVKGTFYGGANHILEVSVSVAYEDGEIFDNTEKSVPAPNFNYSYKPDLKDLYYAQQQQQQQ